MAFSKPEISQRERREFANDANKLQIIRESTAKTLCDLFARNRPQGWRLGGESRLIFVTAEGPCRYNPCLPGERETAPSLGVRLVNAGRKREEKPVKLNRTTELVGQATMDKTTKGVLRRRHAEPAKPGWQAGPKGNGLKVYQAQC